MSSKFLAIPVPRNVSFAISDLNHHHHHRHRHASSIFLLPAIFFNSKKWSPACTSPLILPIPRKIALHPLPSLPPSSSSSFFCNEEEEEETAREAVRQYLEQEVGVSKDESLRISSSSPKYIAMLIHSVQDLDQLSSSSGELAFWSSGAPLSFMDKIYQMAKRKGDKGMLPYLESIGLTLSSASHLARYLSSRTLPTLIHQVKYVKEIFFSDSDDQGLIGKYARTMMMNLSISVDEDVQQTLSFFEKIQARRGGLNLLGSWDASFPQLIESFPGLLQLPIESHVKLMVEFLHHIGVPEGCLGKLFLLFPPLIFYDIEKEVKPRLLALRKVGAEDTDFGMLLLKYPWILSTSILENCENVLDFFDKEKVPQDSVTNAIKFWPLLLGCSINKLKVMVEHFSELHIANKKLGRIIARSPRLLLQKPEEFLEVVLFFKDLGLDKASVGRILARRPEIFAGSIEETLKRKLAFISSIGVSRNQLPRVIKKYPDFFVCDVDRALRPRMMYLMQIGLSKKDVGFMVRRFSPLLGYSIKNVLRPKTQFLVDVMEKPLSDLVDYPRYFSYSLEKKIKPRFWVLKGRNLECSLKDMLNKNDEEFAAEFMGVGRRLASPIE
ncbi:transcription termination factor MTERF2, chloroplastic [Coffea eugenioides]|uniref:transcription termination factor MTERF2, chloroplastic n=1 Tax=Coffea eugenioides TaxID=49369 RepID=UPI000F60F9BB|nr:transcription termination factor MTERF2, chloroplastic [Coffea eugenioides]XP_027154822.1 transcription termination factor MTERF2, chloroplastic [Coffea eugenioides]XP_027154827.1 transcription termination factor MTERF2, chloroplastic [Coffea eugenioides]XP_027154832.1 transcription termination factor MTERF2, chloroplastic [Coffea eugenioides]XP_027154836.1 transcription termination factor MTERF2, chloroplastic [Coffea eugenioides]XP_027154841.1 transcription termination factor MTERF2, chlo